MEVAAEDSNKGIEVEDRDDMVEVVAGSVNKVDAGFSVVVVLDSRGSFAPFAPFPYYSHPPLLSFSKSI